MESSGNVITPEGVLEMLMNDGTIDAIRLKIINQLKANEELKKTTITMVEQSKVLNTPGAEKQTKRELFDALRQELEAPVLEMASKSVWGLILDGNGLGRDISETVEGVFCRLSGREPPLFPQPSDSKNDRVGKNTDQEAPSSSSKKRCFDVMSEDRVDNAAEAPVDPPAVPDGCEPPPSSNTTVNEVPNNDI